uniref:hypothetical protein n=1 Tax=Acetatifactor sp. TaxID=1872090 RepID=UPI004056AEF9
MIAEEYCIHFTTENVGEAWLKYLSYACTAEDVALKNLKKNIGLGLISVPTLLLIWLPAIPRKLPNWLIGTHISVIEETVAMGMDNDCTAATAGSIVGAIAGKKNLSPHWYQNFNNTVDNYLMNVGEMKIDDIINRFMKLSRQIYK